MVYLKKPSFEKTSSIRTKMHPIYVRMKEFSWICLNLLEFNWINLNSWFPYVLLSLSLHFRDIWETRDGPTDRRTHGRTDKASYRDAWTHLKMHFYEFPDVLLSWSLNFRDIWETRDGPTDRRTNGWTDGRTDKASYRDAWTYLKTCKILPFSSNCIEMIIKTQVWIV